MQLKHNLKKKQCNAMVRVRTHPLIKQLQYSVSDTYTQKKNSKNKYLQKSLKYQSRLNSYDVYIIFTAQLDKKRCASPFKIVYKIK